MIKAQKLMSLKIKTQDSSELQKQFLKKIFVNLAFEFDIL